VTRIIRVYSPKEAAPCSAVDEETIVRKSREAAHEERASLKVW